MCNNDMSCRSQVIGNVLCMVDSGLVCREVRMSDMPRDEYSSVVILRRFCGVDRTSLPTGNPWRSKNAWTTDSKKAVMASSFWNLAFVSCGFRYRRKCRLTETWTNDFPGSKQLSMSFGGIIKLRTYMGFRSSLWEERRVSTITSS
jgi:hypothetical protein